MRLAGAMAVFTIATACMTSGLFARYATTADAPQNGRVAGFDIVLTPTEPDKTLALSSQKASDTYSFTIENNSEVKVEYDVIVTLDAPLPSSITLKIGDVVSTPSADGLTHSFPRIGTIAVHGTSPVTLTILATSFGANLGLTDFAVEVVARQIV